MLRNKKGVALTLNTVVIAILVVIVLVVLVGFFLFGFKGLADQAKRIFFGTMAGTDRTLAIQNCNLYCDQAQQLKDEKLIQSVSAYCKRTFSIDEDGDGEADYKLVDNKKVYYRYYCWPGATDEANADRSLEASCGKTISVQGKEQPQRIDEICTK